jgi:hypothetical protein
MALSPSAASAQNCLNCPRGGTGSGTPVTAPPPKPTTQVWDLRPTTGWAGDTVTVDGTGFTGATQVTLGGVPAQFQVQNDNTLTFTVPAVYTVPDAYHNPLPVTVTSPLGTGTSQVSATGGSYTISSLVETYNSQGISTWCGGSGSMDTTVKLDRSEGSVSGDTQISNNSWYCGYTGDVIAVAVDGSGTVIGGSNVIQVSVGAASPLGGIAYQHPSWTTSIDVGNARQATSVYVIQSLDSAATLQSALGEALSAGQTIGSLLIKLL